MNKSKFIFLHTSDNRDFYIRIKKFFRYSPNSEEVKKEPENVPKDPPAEVKEVPIKYDDSLMTKCTDLKLKAQQFLAR